MSAFEVNRYKPGDHVPAYVAEQVSTVFAMNYPLSHPIEEREEGILGMFDGVAVQSSIDRGNTFYVASPVEHNPSKVAGFLKARTIDQRDGTYEQVAWLMVDHLYRGRHVASLLHRSFILDATLRAQQRAPKPTSALLSVHQQNPARAIYESWGYGVIEELDSEKLLMTKPLDFNEQN